MRAVFNTPQGPVVWEAREPVRSDNEALVAVRAFSVNRGELALLAARTEDWRPGQDVAGVVVEAAADGSGPAPGARVGGAGTGAHRPVGRAARRGGHRAGAGHEQELTALGAATVVAAPADADGGQQLISESVGGDSLAAALTKVAPGGTIVICGTSSGRKTPIDVYDFIGHEGARLVSYLSYAHPQPPGPDLQLLVDLVATDRLHPTLGLVEDWSRLGEVLTALQERRLSGKAVLTIG